MPYNGEMQQLPGCLWPPVLLCFEGSQSGLWQGALGLSQSRALGDYLEGEIFCERERCKTHEGPNLPERSFPQLPTKKHALGGALVEGGAFRTRN